MLWAIVIGFALAVIFAALVLCAGGGAWSPDDEEPMPDDYQSPEGYHRHRCSQCETIWEHHKELAGVALAHLCPECGQDDEDPVRGWPVYLGPLPPNHITRTP